MAITYKYKIDNLETAPSAYSKTDVITRIRFTLTGSEGTGDSKKEATFAGCCAMPAIKAEDKYVEFKDLTEAKITAEMARRLLLASPGVNVVDDMETKSYPTPAIESVGSDMVHVGRIREDLSLHLGLNLWVVSDNVRKGAALNSVQIAELLLKEL